MPYELSFETLDVVPEALRTEGLKPGADGSVKISVVPKDRLDEFRNNNISVSQERDQFKQRADELAALVGDDPEAFKTEFESLRRIKQRVDDGELKVSDDVENVVNERVAAMKDNYESLLAEERQKGKQHADRAATLDQRIKQGHIERLITEACLDVDSGVRPEAISEFVRDAMEVFQFPQDGSEPKPMRKGSVIYGENGTDPMTAAEWVASQKKAKGHRFKGSGGGGALGGEHAGSVHGMTPEEFNSLPARVRLDMANKSTPVRKR